MLDQHPLLEGIGVKRARFAAGFTGDQRRTNRLHFRSALLLTPDQIMDQQRLSFGPYGSTTPQVTTLPLSIRAGSPDPNLGRRLIRAILVPHWRTRAALHFCTLPEVRRALRQPPRQPRSSRLRRATRADRPVPRACPGAIPRRSRTMPIIRPYLNSVRPRLTLIPI